MTHQIVRKIIHIDMDAFYAAIEQLENTARDFFNITSKQCL